MRRSDDNAAEHYRYERKALVSRLSYAQIVALVKTHPAMFRGIHHERVVNNIYFDTVTYANYAENVDGNEIRTKVRLRWYGALWGSLEAPTLEFKIKDGALGRKERYAVPGFDLLPGFGTDLIAGAIERSGLPASALQTVRRQEPKMLNRYTRCYFESLCKRYRLTIDRDLTYYGLRPRDNRLLHEVREDSTIVVEIKYDMDADDDAQTISAAFPFALTKSSKYASGLDLLHTGAR